MYIWLPIINFHLSVSHEVIKMDCDLQRITKIEKELALISKQRDELTRKYNRLKIERDELQAKFNLHKSLEADDTLSKSNFPWSDDAKGTLESVFKLKSFRMQQLVAINATLSKKDLLLLMPTGGGKTLCYQLPALVDKGMTLVVSPLLALMEDQLIALRKLNIHAISMSSGTPKDVKTAGFQYMSKGTGKPIKLMYVTPEWLAKSKKFMSSLQKLHEAKKLDRIAIGIRNKILDEVHCCSQWGHDFRPDYKYLSLLKGMFSDVPIIGLTATATTAVLLDIQEMLDIPRCKIIRAPFDRPNLRFSVLAKADKAEDNYTIIEEMLVKQFKNQIGIIYTSTIKDCEEISKGLRSRGLQVKAYHAELPDERRMAVHNTWLDNEIQAVVATVAFGMGIDKADVRFVIHYSIPKSMETLYQEAGRAGRDGKHAECIIMYKLADYLKMSGYTRSKTEINNASSILDYCLNLEKCRHSLIGSHFEEVDIKSCNSMCDNCNEKRNIRNYNAKVACEDIYKIMTNAITSETNLTLIKLIDLWFKQKKLKISKEQAENIVGNLILLKYIKEEKSYTPYSVNCYLRPNFPLNNHTVKVTLNNNGGVNEYLQALSGKRRIDSDDECILVNDDSSSLKKAKTF